MESDACPLALLQTFFCSWSLKLNMKLAKSMVSSFLNCHWTTSERWELRKSSPRRIQISNCSLPALPHRKVELLAIARKPSCSRKGVAHVRKKSGSFSPTGNNLSTTVGDWTRIKYDDTALAISWNRPGTGGN